MYTTLSLVPQHDERAVNKGSASEVDEDEVEENPELEKVKNSISFFDRFRQCPICNSQLMCIDFKGRSQRYVCAGMHIITIDEMLFNN